MTFKLDANACVVGLQWGDEGKGKIVDFLTDSAQVVVRYCGGANAGHTVRIGNEKFATHLLPVGVFRPGVMNLIGNGVVLDPEVLLRELDAIVARGIPIGHANLRVSYKAHVVMPWHKAEDAAREHASATSGQAIGTTRRGIGPTYADKMHRTPAVRVADLVDENRLRAKIDSVIADKNTLFRAMYDAPPLDAREIFDNYRSLGQRIAPLVDDVGYLLLQAKQQGQIVLFEGAHAALLDVDHGTYPYVTSSNCSSLGLFTGAGVPPQYVKHIIGIAKAYSTRVGGGPFPTEQSNPIGDYIRERGREYGTTTGRPRRCGWFDAVAVRYSADLCGTTSVALTLLDVLSGLDQLHICTGYRVKGQRLPYYISDAQTLVDCEPIYEVLPGWKEPIDSARRFDDLPANAQTYVKRIETLAGVPVRLISVGPERSQTLIRD